MRKYNKEQENNKEEKDDKTIENQKIIDARKEVPPHFFDENFDLAIPQTFYKTFYDGTSHHILSEKVIHYLDIIESDLMERLNRRSESFFRALRDLQSLHLTISDTFKTINELKERLLISDEELILNNLVVFSKNTKKTNLKKLVKKFEIIKFIHKSLPTIKKLIVEEKNFQAIEIVKFLENRLENELLGTECYTIFKYKLTQLYNEIKSNLSRIFVELACGYDVLLEQEIQKLKPLIFELQSTSQLINTLENYNEIQLIWVKDTIFDCFKIQNEQILQKNDAIQFTIKNQSEIENIAFEEFVTKLSTLLEIIYSRMVRMREVKILIEQFFEELGEREKKIQDEEKKNDGNNENKKKIQDEEKENNQNEKTFQKKLRIQIKLDLAEIAFDVYELANNLISKIMNLREESHRRISFHEFSHLNDIVSNFITNSNKCVERSSTTLKSIVLGQNKLLIEDWHKKMTKKLSHTLNSENWVRAEIAKEFEIIIQCLFTPSCPITSLGSSGNSENLTSIKLGSESFILINSELIFCKMIYDYLVFLDTFPSMKSYIVTYISDVILLWSKLTFELLLKLSAMKNGAIQTKSINVGHLSLSSNCLSVQIILIPKIKERVLKYFQDSDDISILPYLDNSLIECTQHQQEIFLKIINTMKKKVSTTINTFKTDTSNDSISSSISQLVQTTEKIHKVLQNYLNFTNFKSIFKKIISMYNTEFKSYINGLQIKSPKEKSKLVNNMMFLINAIKELGLEGQTEEILELIHQKFKF